MLRDFVSPLEIRMREFDQHTDLVFQAHANSNAEQQFLETQAQLRLLAACIRGVINAFREESQTPRH